MLKRALAPFALLVLFSSCFKTAEEIEREQMIDQMVSQFQQSQSLVADLTVKTKELQTLITEVNGQIQELKYQQTQLDREKTSSIVESIQQLEQQVSDLKKLAERNKRQLRGVKGTISDQKNYIKKVNKSLSNLSSKKKSSSLYGKGRKAFYAGKYNQSIDYYLNALDNERLSAVETNRTWHHLGIMYFKRKNDQEALVFFSKILKNYPNSSLAPHAMYHVGQLFERGKKVDAAKASYSKVIQQYPKSKEKAKAAGRLKAL